MARHSEDECAYCEGDILPLSYIVGADDQLYCSVKCAEAGARRSAAQAVQWQSAPVRTETDSAHT